jgi:hypothetical protein
MFHCDNEATAAQAHDDLSFHSKSELRTLLGVYTICLNRLK